MKKFFLFFVPLVLLASCGSDDGSGPATTPGVSFSRTELLTNWVNNYISPAVTTYKTDVDALQTAWNNVETNTTDSNISSFLNAYTKAHTSFEAVEVLKIGTIEQNSFTINSNTYPVNTENIETSIQGAKTFNTNLPSSISVKGLATLDYLLYGNGGINERISNTAYKNYVAAVVADLASNADAINNKWSASYKEEFIANDGSGVNASVDDFTNQFIYFYEKRLRAGKVGIPAGVFSSGSTQPNSTETVYQKNVSRGYLIESLNNFERLLNTGSNADVSILDYADAVGAKAASGDNLSTAIKNQLAVCKTKVNTLDQDLSQQVTNDSIKMIETFDELQKLVALLKVDLVQALGISITYVDADGD